MKYNIPSKQGMGNQPYNQQYAQMHNWMSAGGSNLIPQTQGTQQPVLIQTPKVMLEKPSYISQIKTQQPPISDKTINSRIASQIQNPGAPLRHSAIGFNTQQHQNAKEYEAIRGSTIGSQQVLQPQVKQLPEVKILVKPEIPKSGSIIQKNQRKVNFPVRLDTFTQQIDDLRASLRHYQSKMSDSLIPTFQNDIQAMNQIIEAERQMKLKDKNKVLYLLKQKKHYHKLCLKFKDYDQKIKSVLLEFRKKQSIHQITQQEFMNALQLKGSIEAIIRNIEKDLPQKGWKAGVDKPGTKYYVSVVTGAIQDPEIMSKYSQLQQSLTNPQVLQQIVNQQMLHSTTRRIGGGSVEETAKKLIEGPAHYNNQAIRGTRYPQRREWV